MSGRFTSFQLACALCFLSFAPSLCGAAPAGPPRGAGLPGADRPSGDPRAVHLVVDTLAVDGKGTRLVGTDEADLLPGTLGVLEKSVLLRGGGTARRSETVRIKARVTPLLSPPAGAACSVQVDIEAMTDGASATAGARARAPEVTSATLTLSPGEERLMDAYASTAIQGRVTLKLSCSPAGSPSRADDETRLVSLNVTIERTAEGEQTELLRHQVLTAALGRSAVTVAGAHQTLPAGPSGDRRYRSENLEVTLSPVLIVAGKLQIDVRVDGEVATVSADEERVRHPVAATETFVVGPNEPRHLEIDIASEGADEGWSRIRFRVQVAVRF